MAMSMMSDLGLPPILYALVLAGFSARPSPFSLLLAVPALLLNFFYTFEAACSLPLVGGLLSPLATYISNRLVPAVADKTGGVRRRDLVRGLVKQGASWEAYAVILTVLLLPTPFGSLSLTFGLAGSQYMKYSFSVYTRETFRDLDSRVSGSLMAWVPVAAPWYTWLSTLVHNQATSAIRNASARAGGR